MQNNNLNLNNTPNPMINKLFIQKMTSNILSHGIRQMILGIHNAFDGFRICKPWPEK